ncbi:MAG: Coenzyme F420 hydrogenase/dehydrogenase, beta subunit C-terminal domain [Methanophagales archaeon]|nr:Coenzyme F420 hydrogenase/dehydrogenase, beta subunit C-terminal domain [Methanophagales archaeon]
MVEEADATEVKMEERKYVRLPTFLERGFLDLRNAVIAQRICCFCGTCAAFCYKIDILEGEGGKIEPRFIEEYDTVCGQCYAYCPRTFLPQSEIERRIFGEEGKGAERDILGVYRSFYAVRSKKEDILKRAQDGGAVTSLLAYARDEGLIDCAVITTVDNQWKPVTKVARSYEELKEGAGTKYTLYPGVIGVRDAIKGGCEAIGFVGLPCQIQGLRKVQTAEQPYDVGITKVKLLIGLFCMENFTEALLDFVVKQCAGGSLEGVSKFEIRGKELLIYEKEKRRIPLEEIKSYVGAGCSVCMDYTSELADISVGSVGAEQGWSTVFARTEIGEQVVQGAVENGYIEVMNIEKIELESIRRLAGRKKKSGMQRST